MRRMPNRATKPARLTLVRQLKTLHQENGWSEERQAVCRNKGAREITQKHLGEEISSADRLGPRNMAPFRKTALLRSLKKCPSDEDGYFSTGVSRTLLGHTPPYVTITPQTSPHYQALKSLASKKWRCSSRTDYLIMAMRSYHHQIAAINNQLEQY